MRSARAHVPLGWAWAAVLPAAGGCRGCGSRPEAAEAGAAAPAASAPLLPAVQVPTVSPPRFLDLESPRGLGLPGGCRIDLPVRHAAPADEKLRFVAARGVLGSLAMAIAGKGATPERRGLVDLDQHASVDLPWNELDTPPALARSARGWVGAVSRPARGPLSRAVLWRQWTSPGSLLEGDRLEVADLACAADRCALLASLARRAEAPDATLLVGRAGAPARTWKRIDMEADPGSRSVPGRSQASTRRPRRATSSWPRRRRWSCGGSSGGTRAAPAASRPRSACTPLRRQRPPPRSPPDDAPARPAPRTGSRCSWPAAARRPTRSCCRRLRRARSPRASGMARSWRGCPGRAAARRR